MIKKQPASNAIVHENQRNKMSIADSLGVCALRCTER